jgi:hypothetical protein
MNTQQFIQSIASTFYNALKIVKAKNADYATADNPFRTFEASAAIGVPMERAILVRTLDKISRISNLLDKEAEVKDETITDTIVDAINYLAILKARIESNAVSQQTKSVPWPQTFRIDKSPL